MKDEHLYLECDCWAPEHRLRFSFSLDEPDTLYVSVYLNTGMSFLKRILIAFRYVFGLKQYLGTFDESLLSKEKVKELNKLLNNFISINYTNNK